jgi:AraC-like DNA-binding protein
LDFGRTVGGAGFGILGIGAASAGDLASTIRALVRLEPVTSTVGSAYALNRGREIEVGWRENSAPSSTSAIFAEAILTSWVTFGRFLIGERVPIARIEWAHAPTAPRSVYEDIFEAPVSFNAKSNAIILAPEMLSLRSRFAHADLHARLVQSSNAFSAFGAAGSDDLLARATREIQSRFGDEVIRETDIAQALGISPRSLQRHLAAAGFSFRSLLERARVALSIRELLGHGAPALTVGERVGFAEQASFCRAFRRWTGVTPGEFRRLFPRSYAQSR